MNIPYVNLGLQHKDIREEILSSIGRLLDTGQFILGDEVNKFDKTFAEYCGSKYAVSVANGTDALILAMKVLGIGEGDEVITAPNSFLASASSVALVGAKPVFADIGDDMNISPEKIRQAITPRTKAIIPVHLTGRPADMDAINAIAEEHGLAVIEDAAQAVGAKYKGRTVGSLGKMAAFSLHPLKNLNACGDGGVITTNDEKIYQWLLLARNHGLKNRDECAFWSLNSRLDAVQAAILNVKFPHLESWNERRRSIASRYNEAFAEYAVIPEYNDDYLPVFHAYVIQHEKRDELAEYLKAKGVDTKMHYPIAIHQQEAAAGLGYTDVQLPRTARMVKEILSIPVYPELTDEQVDYIISSVLSYFNQQ